MLGRVNSLIGPDRDVVDAEAEKLGAFLVTLGVHFKQLKSRPAALKQLVLGFWWDSVQRTRRRATRVLSAFQVSFASSSPSLRSMIASSFPSGFLLLITSSQMLSAV